MVTVIKEKPLNNGTEIDVEGVAILSEFIGIRAPKEEKKDGKKKWYFIKHNNKRI